VVSTFPDSLARAAPKTALAAVGAARPGQPLPPTQLAAPLIAVDDSPEAYAEEYSDSVLYVEEFRPSDLVHADRGSVLRQVCSREPPFFVSFFLKRDRFFAACFAVLCLCCVFCCSSRPACVRGVLQAASLSAAPLASPAL
jgi:hypothetical protein